MVFFEVGGVLVRIHRSWPDVCRAVGLDARDHRWSREDRGIGALIDGLHARHVETACLSNTTHSHWIRLLQEDGGLPLPGVPPRFAGVKRLRQRFTSQVLGVGKARHLTWHGII
ncbi:MAG TPA: hypothetical protein VFH68_21175 [Polyangia bacterium]|jgi:hypothetical protein|nr:hypothetical protein [Polyangia bacterium]